MTDHAMRTALEVGGMTIGSRSRVVIATILALVIALMAGSFGVMACNTEINISYSASPVIGQAVTITWELNTQTCPSVTFAGTLTRCVKSPGSGTCDVLTGGVETSGGKPFISEYLFSPSTAGIYTIEGSYEGCTTCDPQLNSCSAGPVSMPVSQAGTTTSVVSDNNPSTTGENVTFTATVTSSWVGGPAIGGTVTFSANKAVTWVGSNTVAVSGGTASVQASFDANDSPITITATYDETSDANYATSSGNLSQIVLTGTTTVVTSNKNTISTYPGTCENVMFTATVTPVAGSGTPTGTVDFYKGGTTLIGSGTLESAWPFDEVSISTTFYAVESGVSITATYNGDADYAGSDGSLDPDQTVVPANTTTSITSDAPDPSVLGQPYLVTGTVIGSHGGCRPTTGTVTVTDGQGNGCAGDVDLNGDWSCSITSDPTTPAVTYNLTARYNGEDPNFAASGWSASELHTYTNPTTRTEVMGADTPLIVNNTATFTVVVVDTSAIPTIPTGTVDLSVSPYGKGTLLGVVTSITPTTRTLDAAGRCTFTYTPTSADPTPHAVTAVYVPGSHAASTGTFAQEIVKRAADIQLALTPTTAYIYEPVTLQIHVEDDTTEGTPGSLAGEPVTLSTTSVTGWFDAAAPGADYTAILNATGDCTVTYTPGPGEAGTTTITATFDESGVYTEKSTSENLVVNLRPTETRVICSMETLLVNETEFGCTITVKDVAGVGTATAPGGSISSLTTDLSGTSAVYNLSGPTTPSGTDDSKWTFDYLCTGLDDIAGFDIIQADYTASDGIHADSAGVFVQGIQRRPTITTLSGCFSTPDGVTCTATVEEDSGNAGVPVTLEGDFVLVGNPDEDITGCTGLSGASASCVDFDVDSGALVTNVTVRFEPTDNVHRPSMASENVDRSDQFSTGGGDDSDGSNCDDGCGTEGVNITEMLQNLRELNIAVSAIKLGLSQYSILLSLWPEPIIGTGTFVIFGTTIPVKDIAAAIVNQAQIAFSIYQMVITTDIDGDGLPDIVERHVTETEYNDRDSDDDVMSDGLEILVAGGYYGGSRRPDPNDPDSDNDGLTDGEEYTTYDTNPCVADTDCDGVNDGDEVDTWGCSDPRDHADPLVVDTDGDGLDDDIEFSAYPCASCPYVNDDDSDDDGLQDGYEDANQDGTITNTIGDNTSHGSGETDFCNSDTDADGLLDGEEEGLFGLEVTPEGVSGTVGSPGGTISLGGSVTTVPALDSDMDNDYLTDYEEVNIYQTDPMDADTDDDTLMDSIEVATWDATIAARLVAAGVSLPFGGSTTASSDARDHSNPRMQDTDGDGLTDDLEIAYGCTYVNDDDSDDDGLQDGWEDRNRDGDWDYTTLDKTSTGHGIGETDPCDPDTDDDGLLDGEEEGLFGQGLVGVVHPLGSTNLDPALDDDSDNDGLSDYEEVNITGTNPLHWDTDGDGISDADELITTGGIWPKRTFIQESDPLDPDTDDDYLSDGIEWTVGHTYAGTGLGDSTASSVFRKLGGIPDTICPYVNDDDSDDDGLQDGTEDANHDGTWGVNGAGITVGSFSTQATMDGTVTYWECDLCNPDTDGDGLLDGEEVALIGGGPILGRPRPVPGFYTVTPEEVSTVLPLGTGPAGSPPGTGNSQLGPYTFIPIAGVLMTGDKTVPALDVDSDNDGLSDYEEVNITGTDPLDQDSDNDTLMDSDELIATGGTVDIPGNPGTGPRRTFDQESDPLDINTDDDHLFDPQEYAGSSLSGKSGGLSTLLGVDRDTDCPFVNDDDSDDDGLQDGLVVYVDPQTSLGYDYSYTHYEDFVDIQAYSGLGVDSPGYAKVTVSPATDYEQYDDTLQNVCDCDSDGDGLYDGEEVAIGTDPDDWDTDDDGRSDWHEHTGGGPIPTDPFDPDTDDDGLTDSVEVFGLNPTNPVNADTDGDGLCDGGTGTPWMISGDARVIVNPICKSCSDPGLTSCGTLTRGGSVDGIGDHPNPHGYGEDKDGDGTWDGTIGQLWQSGDPGTPETDPNQYDTDGDALADGIEVLGFSTSRQGWIPTTDLFGRTINVTYPACGCLEPLIADTDGDGLEDGYEDNNHDGNFDFLPSDFDYAPDPLPGPPQPNPAETNPCDPDTDDDDLTDYEERYQSQVFVHYDDLTRPFNPTNPLDHDTDNDWLLDGFEVKYVCVAVTYSQLDNDGDGLIDEDPIDGLDNDGDGLIDEDPVDFFVRFVPMLDPTCRDSDSDGWIDGLDDDPCNSELIPLLQPVQIEPIDSDGDGFADADEIVAGTHPNDPEDYPVAYYAIDLDFDQAIDDRLWLERSAWSGIANSVVIDIDCNVLIDARVQIVAPRDVKQGDFDGDGAEDDYRYVVEYAFSNYRVLQPRIVLTIYDYNGDLVIDHAEVVRK